jgi:transposase
LYTVGGKISDKILQKRINIKFCVKIGKCASETSALLTVAYGEYAMKKSSVFEWQRQFKKGRENVQDDPRSGQPKTQKTDANVDRVRTLVRSDQRLDGRVIAEELNINRETVRQIVKEDLGMRKISAKMVPRILTHNKKQRRLHISFLAKNSITKMDQLPYSPDLAPADFLLFPKLKNALKGQRITDLPEIQRNVKTLL